jgi:hypothetical protein
VLVIEESYSTRALAGAEQIAQFQGSARAEQASGK